MLCIGGTQIRTAALHALGIVAGAHRADHAMSAPAEDTFRQVTFTAAAGPSGFQAPAELLLGFLRQPFADLRTGAYRCALSHSNPQTLLRMLCPFCGSISD